MELTMRFCRGLSVIEVLIAFAVTSVFLVSSLPAHRDALVRAKVGQGLLQASGARDALQDTCDRDRTAIVDDFFDAASRQPVDGNYIHKIEMAADCANQAMVVVVWTVNTGAAEDPVLALSANDDSGWHCSLLAGESRHAPAECLET